MQSKSCLTMESYIVKKIKFLINEDFSFDENTTVGVTPEFKKQITKIDEDNASVILGFLIDNKEKDMPFSIDVEIEGVFRLDNWEHPDRNTIIQSNAIAILFPYLRSVVSMITANANIPPYVIPVMNIVALFNKAENGEAESSE